MTQLHQLLHPSKLHLFFYAGFLTLSAFGCASMQGGNFLRSDYEDYQSPVLEEDGVFYTVQSGDSLWSIAQKFNTDSHAIQAANDIKSPKRLQVGMFLFIPGAYVSAHGISKTQGSLQSSGKPLSSHSQITQQPQSPTPKPSKKQASAARSPFRDLCWPVANAKLTSRFGKRWGRHHDGIDLARKIGSPIRAAAAGVAILVKTGHAGYGNIIILSHENGFFTVYAHNKKNLIKKGQRVQRCEKIALLGKTGRVTGPHLHFEVRQGKAPRNPLLFLEP